MRKHIIRIIASTALAASITANPALAADQHSTAKEALIRCLAAGAVAGIITIVFTWEPYTTATAAAAACTIAGGEEVVAGELRSLSN